MTTTIESISTIGTTQHVPPGSLLLERNIRDAKADPELVASIRDRGVLQPVTARLNDDGQFVLRMGYRRTLAAIEAERDTIPVYIAGHVNDGDADEIDRIIEQRDENTHRAGLTAGEEANAVAQLALLGLSADQIADQARIAKDRVNTALKVNGSKLASKAADRYEALTLDQAATVAEFDDDTETAKKLIVTAIERPGQFAHDVQRARDERHRAQHHARLVDELTTAGVPVLDGPPTGKGSRLYYLTTKAGKNLTPSAHKKCPGHVAWIDSSWQWIDADGQVATSSTHGARQVTYPSVSYGCSDWAGNGHKSQISSPGGSSKTAAADMTDEQREAANKARKLVIENNKAWDAAEPVRRQWVSDLAKLKTPPKGTAAFIAAALNADRDVLHDYRTMHVTTELLGCGSGGFKTELEKLLKNASENRSQVLVLFQVLAGYESSLTRDSWRGNGTTNAVGRYLRFIQSAGYELSDVEKFAIGSKTA